MKRTLKPECVLTAEQIKAYTDGATQLDLCAMTGYSLSTVSKRLEEAGVLRTRKEVARLSMEQGTHSCLN